MTTNERQYDKLTQRQLDDMEGMMHRAIIEKVHAELAPCSPGRFLARYIELDPDFPVHQFQTSDD
jgi:hypothetical protein